MKHVFLLCLIIRSTLSFGQINIDREQLVSNWSKIGIVDAKGNLIIQDSHTDHNFYLFFNPDSKVTIQESDRHCGYGHRKQGNWALNLSDTSLVLNLDKRISFGEKTDSVDIQETQYFKIKNIKSEELILSQLVDSKEITFVFRKNRLIEAE